MDIGILKEVKKDESRVPLTPMGVAELKNFGAKIFVEKGAGEKCGYSNEEYASAGAQICYNAQEVIGRSKIILKISSPTLEEIKLFNSDQLIVAFWQLVLQSKEAIEIVRNKRLTVLGMEIIETKNGDLPVLHSMSEIAGYLSATVAQYLLQNSEGGRGILFGGGPGIPPAVVVILGAGAVGTAAARACVGLGAQVFMLDKNVEKLRSIYIEHGGRVLTSISTKNSIQKALSFANAVIGAVAIPGQRTPILITREMLRGMRKNGVLLDLSIDLGGISETSRPTTLSNPVYIEENIIHYCVPNMPSNVARTATQALNNSLLPYIEKICLKGIEGAMSEIPDIKNGIYIHRGNYMKPWLVEYFPL
jgi:alanine dehydrogenase